MRFASTVCNAKSIILIKLSNQPIYNIKIHFMDRESQLIRLCTSVLDNATPVVPDLAESVLVNQEQYNTVVNTITNHHVAFVFCLSVKRYLKSSRKGLVGPQAIVLDLERTNCDSQVEVIRIAEGTQLYQYLQNQPSKLYKVKEHQGPLYGSKFKGDREGKGLKDQLTQCPRVWYQSIIFLNILASFNREDRRTHNFLRKETTSLTGVKNLIAELFAKLFAIICIESSTILSWSDCFIKTLKFLVNFDEGDQAKSQEQILLIICELIQYLQDQQQSWTVKILLRLFGKQINSLLIAYLSQSLANQGMFRDKFNFISNKLLASISQYVSLANDPKKGGFHRYSNNIEDIMSQKRSYKMDELMKFNFQFIQESQKLLAFINDYQTWRIATPLMQVVDKITLIIYLEDYKDPNNEKYRHFQYSLSSFFHLFVMKWLQFEAGEQEVIKDDEYHLESLIINSLGQIVNNCFPFFFDNKDLLNLIISQFCDRILSRIPIEISLGQASPISCTFYFLSDIARFTRRLHPSSNILSKIRLMTQKFLERCSQTEYNEAFLCHSEEVESCSQFFLPLIQLLEKLYDSQQDNFQDHLFSYLLKQLRNQQNVGFKSVLNVMMIEMIRNVEFFQGQDVSKQKKGELLLCLLDRLSKSKDIQYMMLLDAVSQMDDQSFELSENTSAVCLIVTSIADESLASFMKKITGQITNFLLTSDSLYLANYAIHILTRMCKNVREICLRGKMDAQVINIQIPKLFKYMEPVVEFVKSINLTVLEESDSYEQRGKLFQLICYIGINQIEDVYKIYSLVRRNLCGDVGPNQLKYLIDVAGLLSTTDNDKIDEVIIELVLLDLKDFNDIFSNFTARALENELYFKIYTDFLLKFMGKLIKSCKKDQEILARFPQIFEGKLDIFAELYDETNYTIIHSLYLAYAEISPIRGKLPKIPCVFFSQAISTTLIDRLFRNIERLQGIDEVKKLFSNTFLRNILDFPENIDEGLKGEIADPQNLPQYMLLLADYLDSEDIPLFFNSQAIIQSSIARLFNLFKDENMNSATFDSYDFDDDFDASYEMAGSMEDFCRVYKGKRKFECLMTAIDTFAFLEKRDGRSFLEPGNFSELAKKILEACLVA